MLHVCLFCWYLISLYITNKASVLDFSGSKKSNSFGFKYENSIFINLTGKFKGPHSTISFPGIIILSLALSHSVWPAWTSNVRTFLDSLFSLTEKLTRFCYLHLNGWKSSLWPFCSFSSLFFLKPIKFKEFSAHKLFFIPIHFSHQTYAF